MPIPPTNMAMFAPATAGCRTARTSTRGVLLRSPETVQGPKQRSERFAARANVDRPKDPIERMYLRAEVMGQRAAGLKKLADVKGAPDKSLDDGQKRRFAALARLDRGQMRGHHGWQQHHRGMRGGMMDNDGGR